MRTYPSNPFSFVQYISLLCFIFAAPIIGSGQEAILPAGGDATGVNGSASYSLGQLFYSTIENNTGSVSLGVQLCYEISVVTKIEETENIRIECAVSPNPVTDIIKLTIQHPSHSRLSYTLYNSIGQIIVDKSIIKEGEAFISMSALTPSLYYLEIKTDTQPIKTFKIIKN
ncbi:MAG: T9SS type A sorting domain-containing protein [Bacteroidota bacterium]